MLRSSALAITAVTVAACSGSSAVDRAVVTGRSPLVAMMNEAAREHDVPAEILASLAWTETALIAPRVEHDPDHDAHVPQQWGVMGLPEESRTRSVAQGAALLGVDVDRVRTDPRENVRAAAALLRAIADELYGPGALAASGARDRWLAVVSRFLDAGDGAALEVRRTAARGLEAFDAEGRSLIIPSYAELWPEAAPGYGTTKRAVNGEYPGSTFVAANSGNYTNASRTGADIDVVVIHTVQGSYAGAISWFQNASANVSAHYVVRRSDGAITQSVHHADIAWHAGNWSYNQRSIGIEHEGFVSDANNYTPAMLESSARLTRWLCDTLGIPRDRSHIIGHVEVPGATHTDPGQYFPWTQYMNLVNNGGSTMMPPPTGNGTLQGVVYLGGDTAQRIPGATLTVTPSGASVAARAGDAYWSFSLAPGNYTVTAAAPGYQSASVTRAVGAGDQVWGSLGLTPATTPGVGKLKGSIFDARHPDFSVRLPGATVRLSNGTSLTARESDGYFEFEAPAGDYTVTVSLAGWQTVTVPRSIAAGGDTWGSIGLSPEQVTPTNRPPAIPVLSGPIGDVTTRGPEPVFTVIGLQDADGDALALDVELYAEESLSTRVSSGRVEAGRSAVVSWRHPAADLPRGGALWWRVRASDGTAQSGWSAAESFRTYDDGSPAAPSTAWTATVLPGVGVNRGPSAPEILEPLDTAVLGSVRPRIAAADASDPDGDALAYEFEVASDDVFGSAEAHSGPIDMTAWVVDHDLAPGGTFYVRVRAADDRVFGGWSAAVAFSISAQAISEERPGYGGDVGAPVIEAKVIAADGGCSAVGGAGSSALWAPLAAAALAWGRARRRRAA